MNFALIGDDSAILRLIDEIAIAADCQITHGAQVDAIYDELVSQVSSVKVLDRWEDLLPIESIDAVIVCGYRESSIEAAKQFVSNARPVLLLPHPQQGLGAIYELTLSRDEAGASLIPVIYDCCDVNTIALRQAISRGDLGRILLIQVEFHVPPTSPSSDRALLSAEQVDAQLLTDVELLRLLGGDYNQVTAVHSKAEDNQLVMATVTLSADGAPESSWSMKPATGEYRWTLTVKGENGSAELSRANPDSEFQLTFSHSELQSRSTTERVELIDAVKAGLQGESIRPNWTDVTRDFEIVEATHRSIARRRTIDLHFETTSERSVFKSQMTVAGCGLLVLTLLSLLVLLAAGALFDNRDPVQVNSESVGFVLGEEDFESTTAELTPTGMAHVESIATRINQVPHSVLIGKTGSDDLDLRRRDVVVARLRELDSRDVDRRTIVIELRGQTVSMLMKIARIAWVFPLVLFLILQTLLFVAKPSSTQSRQNSVGTK